MNAETESLVCYLDEQRDSVVAIAGGLAEAALRRAVFPSGWTCLGLIITWPSMTGGTGSAASRLGSRPASRRVRIRAGWPGRKPRLGRCSAPYRGGDRPDAIIAAAKGMTWIP